MNVENSKCLQNIILTTNSSSRAKDKSKVQEALQGVNRCQDGN